MKTKSNSDMWRYAPKTQGDLFAKSNAVLLMSVLTAFAMQIACAAEDIMVAGGSSCVSSGLFCFRTLPIDDATNTRIHLVRYADDNVQVLFTKTIDHLVKDPICLTNGVVVVSSDGTVSKLDFKGDVIFAAKPKGFDGVCGLIGRHGSRIIYMTGTSVDTKRKDWNYQLFLVDVGGNEPVIKEKHQIVRPAAITQSTDELVVIGDKDTLRFPVP